MLESACQPELMQKIRFNALNDYVESNPENENLFAVARKASPETFLQVVQPFFTNENTDAIAKAVSACTDKTIKKAMIISPYVKMRKM